MHPTTLYAKQVINGKIPACRWVIKTCERHLLDLKRPPDPEHPERNIYFDEDAANKAIAFFDFLHHIKGKWAKRTSKFPKGQLIKLELWQKFVTGSIFGWYKDNSHLRDEFGEIEPDTRRFKTILVVIPRKNAKSTTAAGWAGYCFCAEGEEGAEVYTVATKQKQARIVFDLFKAMVLKSDDLHENIEILTHNINMLSTNSKFEPMPSEAKTLDGLNPHCTINDEIHEWRDPELWDVIKTAMGSRENPLQIAITTAGWDRNGICYILLDYLKKILMGVGVENGFSDDSFFGINYTVDLASEWPDLQTKEEYEKDPTGILEDQWDDEKSWIKANPNINVSLKLSDLRADAIEANEIPSSMNGFLKKRLNIWTQQLNRWIPMNTWDKNGGEVYVMD